MTLQAQVSISDYDPLVQVWLNNSCLDWIITHGLSRWNIMQVSLQEECKSKPGIQESLCYPWPIKDAALFLLPVWQPLVYLSREGLLGSSIVIARLINHPCNEPSFLPCVTLPLTLSSWVNSQSSCLLSVFSLTLEKYFIISFSIPFDKNIWFSMYLKPRCIPTKPPKPHKKEGHYTENLALQMKL